MNRNNKYSLPNFFIHLFFLLLSCAFIIPILTMISVSLSREEDILKYGYSIIPRSFSLEAYSYVFNNLEQIINSYKVTVFTSFFGTFLALTIMLMCAYALSRKGFKLKSFIAFYLFFTMMFGGGLIPKYILMTQYLHLQNTVWAIIFNNLVNVWYIFILRAFLQEIDDSIIESAQIDGASEYRIFTSLIVPMSKPAIATIGLFMLLGKWNQWMAALLYIDVKELYTLQYLLQKILQELHEITQHMDKMPAGYANTQKLPTETMRMALAIMVAGPMLFIMPFFQKYFVRGIRIGSIKG